MPLPIRLLPFAIALLLSACSDGVDWSERERDNAAHLFNALRLTSEAATIANDIDSPEDLAGRRDELLKVLRAAHWNAAAVDDTVLDKLHPQMYARFRIGFQRALADMLRAYETNDIDAAQNAAADIYEFMNWYRSERHTFRWWDDAMPRT